MSERTFRRRRVLALSGSALVGGVGLAGCIEGPWTGDTDGSGPDPNVDDYERPDHSPGEPETHVEVLMESLDGESHHFSPLLVHVEEGGTVEWVLVNGIHNSVAYHPDNADDLTPSDPQRIPEDAEPWASPTLDEREREDEDDEVTWEHTFEGEGVYDYACTPHERWGMVGSVIVGWPDPDGQPALEEPSEDHDEDARATLESLTQQTRGVLEDDGDEGQNSDG